MAAVGNLLKKVDFTIQLQKIVEIFLVLSKNQMKFLIIIFKELEAGATTDKQK